MGDSTLILQVVPIDKIFLQVIQILLGTTMNTLQFLSEMAAVFAAAPFK